MDIIVENLVKKEMTINEVQMSEDCVTFCLPLILAYAF